MAMLNNQMVDVINCFFFFLTTIYNWRWLALSTGADAALRPLRARHAETSRQEGQLEGGRWNEPKASFEVGEVKWFIYPDEVLPTINENKTLHIYVYIYGLIDTVLLMYFYLCYKKELHDFRYWLWAIMFFVFFFLIVVQSIGFMVDIIPKLDGWNWTMGIFCWSYD